MAFGHKKNQYTISDCCKARVHPKTGTCVGCGQVPKESFDGYWGDIKCKRSAMYSGAVCLCERRQFWPDDILVMSALVKEKLGLKEIADILGRNENHIRNWLSKRR